MSLIGRQYKVVFRDVIAGKFRGLNTVGKDDNAGGYGQHLF